MRLDRRTLLAGAVGLTLAGCRHEPSRRTATKSRRDVERIRYGSKTEQYADLRRPAKASLGTVVLVHGGYWLPGYGPDLMTPLAERFTSLGYATWNIDYRRTGQGGGYPATLEDAAAALDALRDHGSLAERVVLVGHSAGGQLAGWLASRSARTPGGGPKVKPAGVVSLSGVLDLTQGASEPGPSGPVVAFMGGTPRERPEAYALADPARLVPAACPVWAMHADHDTVVPRDQATSYVEKALAAHAKAEVIDVPGDHFTLIDPADAAFDKIHELVEEAL